MPLITTILIALSLSMDAFAVSITSGIAIKQMRIRHAVCIASFFGFFQAVMPLLGWLCGNLAIAYIEPYDHWIAFVLLVFVGSKMIRESFAPCNKNSFDPLDICVLFMLSIATSIDALAMGITFSLLNVKIIMPVVIIGVTTFILSFAGTYSGDFFGDIFGKKPEIFGGVVLIAIGCKILIEHLFLR